MQKSSKTKTGNVSAKALGLLLLAGLVVCIPFRLVQLFTNIEPNTGFFIENNWTVYCFYAVVVLFVIALAVVSGSFGKIPASRPVLRRDKTLAICSFLFAVGIAYDVIFALAKVMRALTDGSLSNGFFSVMFTDGMFAQLLQAICGMAACIYIILVALSYVGEKATYCDYRFLAIMPLFWALFRMVSRFMTKISFTMVSELLLELLMLAFMLLFLMSFARVSAQVNQKGEMKKIVRYGMPAAFLALLIGITRLVCTVGGRADLLADGFQFSLADIGFGAFAVAYIFTHMRYGRPASEDDLLPDADAAEEKTETAQEGEKEEA